MTSSTTSQKKTTKKNDSSTLDDDFGNDLNAVAQEITSEQPVSRRRERSFDEEKSHNNVPENSS